MPDIKKDQEIEEKAKKSMNYNDRLDGYGFGEADSESEEEIEKGPNDEKAKNVKENEKYGPVDQYSFREAPIGDQHQSNEKTHRDIEETP